MSRHLNLKISSGALLALAGAAQIQQPAFMQHASAQPMKISLDSKSRIAIVLPQRASLPEQTAARELTHYLARITGGTFVVRKEGAQTSASAIYVGATAFATRAGVKVSALPSEAWRIKTHNKNLILAGGGTRGTLYATYRFLEDYAGVRWWNPWEDSVPGRRVLSIPALNKSGKPAFAYRDIYMLYGSDNGRFAIRNRLDRDGDAPIGAEYGGSRNYGPPYHVHTFFTILYPDVYYAEHPDWFIGNGKEKPTAANAQLALSNPAMRQEFLKLLREMIRKSHREAREKGLPVPDVFSVSQMDNLVGFASTPADAELVKENGGADAAVLLDFINFLADSIKEEFPGVYIDTLAYFSGEQAPTKIRPRDNVIIRLTDTTSNLILPITHPRNDDFRKKLESWSKITKNLRVWDYAVTYAYPGLPMPTANTYATDLKFMLAHNVEGIFVEHEYPILADMRDFKVWLQCKLFEDPTLNYDALVKQFTDGFYGPAGALVRKYIYALQNEAETVGKKQGYEDISWFVPGKQSNFLSLDFLMRASAIFDEAEKSTGSNKVLLRRVRHARLSLDRATALHFRRLAMQWVAAGNTPESMPLNREAIVARYLDTWNEQIDIRLPEAERAAERLVAKTEATKMTAGPVYTPLPAKFRDIPLDQLSVFGPTDTRNWQDHAKVVEDASAEGGVTTRLEIPEANTDTYKLPMPWNIYDKTATKEAAHANIRPEDVTGPGYHWYKMSDVVLPNDNSFLYFYPTWFTQIDLVNVFEPAKPNQKFDIWANIKFEGPLFSHGKAEDKNAISIERVVVVKK
jgi:hypothetical protein